MGGRGGIGGAKETAFSVTMNGETTEYKFTKKGKQNYFQRGIGGHIEETPLNMSASEFRKRVESNGATVKKMSVSSWNKTEKAREIEHMNRPDYELGMGLKDNSAYRKKARRDRLTTRMMKRKR
jgi:hypothetical protein|nr:MAG TPA: hypothetical protein [Caudoviricetes sp.]